MARFDNLIWLTPGVVWPLSAARGGGAVIGLVGYLLLWVAGFALLERSAEAVGLGAGLNDVRAVGNPVDQGLAQAGVGNHLGPLRERQGRQGLINRAQWFPVS